MQQNRPHQVTLSDCRYAFVAIRLKQVDFPIAERVRAALVNQQTKTIAAVQFGVTDTTKRVDLSVVKASESSQLGLLTFCRS